MAGCALAIAPIARAAAPPAPAPDLAASPDVRAAVDYLQALGPVGGRFEQTDGRGAATTGSFFLQRPGRARFDYDPPSALSIISDGHKVFVINAKLRTLQGYPLGMTPLGLFLARQIRLDRGARVTAVDRRPGGFSVTAVQRGAAARGSITLDFARPPLTLRGWTTTTGAGQAVRVRLLRLAPAPARDAGFFDAHGRAAQLGIG